MAAKQQIQDSYIDYVLTSGQKPASVYAFAKKAKITETEFYDHFGSFEGIERSVWAGFTERTIEEIKQQETWPQYSSREKALSFFYAFTELLKTYRSFIIYSYQALPKSLTTPSVLTGSKNAFSSFADDLIREGLESGELAERKFLDKRYKDALWAQFTFILNFWIKDSSAGFEKTDEAIEKGINVTFDLFERSAIDNLIDYGKFLFRNGNLHNPLKV